jgi:hypothetical protein
MLASPKLAIVFALFFSAVRHIQANTLAIVELDHYWPLRAGYFAIWRYSGEYGARVWHPHRYYVQHDIRASDPFVCIRFTAYEFQYLGQNIEVLRQHGHQPSLAAAPLA